MYRKYLLLLSLLFANTLLGFTQKSTPKPNILFITIDDLRPELGCYGSKRVLSPHIDALAKASSIFMNAYCNSAVCGPSRASLLTGVRPIPNKRFKDWNCRADQEAKEMVSLPEYLKNNGYYTLSNGKVMHDQDDSPNAWTEPSWRSGHNRGAGVHYYNDDNDWLNPASAQLVKDRKGPYTESADVADSMYHDGEITNKTIADLKRLKQLGQPFFLATGFWRPHLPFNAPKKYWDMYQFDQIPIATNRFQPKNAPAFLETSKELLGQYAANEGFPTDTNFHRQAIHGYLASVSYIDAQVGRIMDTLKALDLDKNTLVVLLGDHGFHLGEHNFWGKHNTMNLSVNAPLLVYVPGKKPMILPQNVEFVDIYPSLCELAGLEMPSHLDGKSFGPILEKPKRRHKEIVFTGHANALSVKYKKLLYTEWDKGATAMLYNHATDPAENENVLGKPKYKKQVRKMHQAMERLRAGW
jgi:iduronate 2-sulfatase